MSRHTDGSTPAKRAACETGRRVPGASRNMPRRSPNWVVFIDCTLTRADSLQALKKLPAVEVRHGKIRHDTIGADGERFTMRRLRLQRRQHRHRPPIVLLYPVSSCGSTTSTSGRAACGDADDPCLFNRKITSVSARQKLRLSCL